jgi:hypothetical protein
VHIPDQVQDRLTASGDEIAEIRLSCQGVENVRYVTATMDCLDPTALVRGRNDRRGVDASSGT